ncbi:MAG: tRNA pseudouridine(38-40) synthase TruA [Candidatus Heimdallarchaeota archaeon]|nr:MAG: tRNA pseudouridine(38-40) synthase TruA [Candidatus Heimdallarchaeota archaeon]
MPGRFAIKIAYIGKEYQGFQRQTESIKTVEGTILDALTELEIINNASESKYSAAGRTDKGVNAISQVIAFDSLRDKIYLEEINNIFPRDIYAWAIAEVKENFHPRRDALLRTYRLYHYYFNENLKLMTKAVKKLKGTHDFAKLCKKPDKLHDGSPKSTVLTLETAKFNLQNNLLVFEFSSRSFLWNQVRKMVSVILDIGSGKYPPEIIDEILNPPTFKPKGGIKPVPPDGLVLYDVYYENIEFISIAKKTSFESRLREKINFYSSTSAVLELMKDTLTK